VGFVSLCRSCVEMLFFRSHGEDRTELGHAR
jgi:hypothetical protein